MAPSKSPPQPEQATKRYFIVNPAGAIHEVTRKIASMRLKTDPRYRLANSEEIARYEAASGNQRAGRPLCEPYSANPDLEPEVD
jgi:hypothetical protein